MFLYFSFFATISNNHFQIQKGYKDWTSETDTEVIVKLALYVWDTDEKVRNDFLRLTLKVVHHLEGAYALILKSDHFPGEACAVRRSSPLVLGIKADSLQEDIIRMINTTRNLKLSTDTVSSLAEGAFKLEPEHSAEYYLVCSTSLFLLSFPTCFSLFLFLFFLVPILTLNYRLLMCTPLSSTLAR